jgi:anti-sigma factor RsiW
MNKEYCERIRISAMAIRDGESPPLAEQEVKKHLESCADCRLEIGRQEQAIDLLDGRSRRVFAQDVWPRLSPSLVRRVGQVGQVRQARPQGHARPEQSANALPFVILCLFLLAYKVVEVLPFVTAGVAVKLIPVGVLVLFFALLKQNPFEINPNLGRRQASLRLQGDTK